MLLQDSFARPIGRPIETVIKADDTDHVKQEVEEYVITQELSKKLELFFAAYKDASPGVVANGVWISGLLRQRQIAPAENPVIHPREQDV